jgi:membrane fusion protein (multidrug efflux system)
LLLRLDEVRAGAALAEAEANFKLSRVTYDRSRQLFQDKLISQQEFDQAGAQFQAHQASVAMRQRELKDARIVAPFEGIVSSRQVSPGQVISKNTTLTWLVDLDPVKVELNVPERFVSQLRLGQKLEITVAAFPARVFSGEVFFIAPFVEANTRTALVKARVPNPQDELKPGMFANLDLTLRLKEQAIVIPETSVMATGDRTVIYVVDKQDTAQIRPVKLGLRQAGIVEIAEGLKAGERVVVEGHQKIRPGGKVKPVKPVEPIGSDAGEKGKPL